MAVSALFHNARDRHTVEAGAVVFRAGDPGTHMFGVISGEVELRDGDRVVATVEPGGVFGELALIDEAPRSLDAVAAAESTLALIDRRVFLFLIHETPNFALDVMRSMATRLRALTGPGPG